MKWEFFHRVPARRHPGRHGAALLIGFLCLPALLPSFSAARQLRYHPDGTDFVIDNGTEWFNRPLYGPHTAFRIDGGDKPEFALLHTAAKDGVLRLGLIGDKSEIWLPDAQHITTRYRPGSLIYDIQDPLLGDAMLRLTALSMSDGEGLLLKAETLGPTPAVQLVWIFGGVSAAGRASAIRAIDENGGQDLRPRLMLTSQQCQGNSVTFQADGFSIRSGSEVMAGSSWPIGQIAAADSRATRSIRDLLASTPGDSPLVVGRVPLDQAVYLAVGRNGAKINDLPQRFAAAEVQRQSVAESLKVQTPDPYINAAAGAICVAADGCWQSPTWMHGAVSWRVPLLGWRGAYIGDSLGWHDRASAYFNYWAGRQNVAPDFPTVAVANPARNLAENDGGMLHSNGSIPQTHYDMNLVYIDALFRHLLWTGDLDEARKFWPVIQRHLAWEKRCFDRDGLYEGYACIWASDALQYNGGGAAHSSAYNEFHNRTAARLARLIGQDPAPYEQEAARIHRAIQSRLWMADRGWYAEYQDEMGEKQLHPFPALWTIYHCIDSGVPDAFQAWQSLRYVDTQIAPIPVRGPGVPAGDFQVLPTSNWMPYEWSLNNVVTAENAHAALAYWQTGRANEGFKRFKSTLLDTMYMGMEPGNVPNLSAYDPYRGESYTDFADAIGITSRAMVEGLFGLNPDALAGELVIRPGFPLDWDHASITARDVSYSFRLSGRTESWIVQPRFPKPMRLALRLPARGDGVQSVLLNGKPVQWANLQSIGQPWIEIRSAEAADRYEVSVTWNGAMPGKAFCQPVIAQGAALIPQFAPAHLIEIFDPQKTLTARADSFLATGPIGHRTAFAKVRQGELTWWSPLEFEIRPDFEIIQATNQDAKHVRFRVRNNTARPTHGIPALAESAEMSMPADSPGTTRIQVDLGDGQTVRGEILNWQIHAGRDTKWEPIDLSGAFNDQVTRIFLNDYLTPRPQTCSLQIPLHGIGDWTGPQRTYAVNDSGLRGAGGMLTLPDGVPFRTPSDPRAKNIAFTSQWDNYPRSITIPLTGHASHVYFLLAGSTDPMQSRLDNGEITIAYADGTIDRLALHNPANWWPIDKNYRIDDYAFRRPEPVPLRVELATGRAYFPSSEAMTPGGSATVLDVPLDPAKELKIATLHTQAWGIVIGMMSMTLQRP
jgi:Domain of unknown function (DUF4450)